jgi:hypothetical protein
LWELPGVQAERGTSAATNPEPVFSIVHAMPSGVELCIFQPDGSGKSQQQEVGRPAVIYNYIEQ